MNIILTVLGFAATILANAFVPQLASGVVLEDYKIGFITLNMNSAFRIVLFVLIVFYAALGIFSLRDEERKRKYAKRMPFRLVMGLLLLLWDLLGTKLLILPQPFFPGPAGIIKALLMESDFILQNTL